ncbi:unnamed protein product [Amoebophrya sp. A25]|nr:unnamed protein product [Amoebophrya sp. A25]|eukprot:GSA25T00008475001.1
MVLSVRIASVAPEGSRIQSGDVTVAGVCQPLSRPAIAGEDALRFECRPEDVVRFSLRLETPSRACARNSRSRRWSCCLSPFDRENTHTYAGELVGVRALPGPTLLASGNRTKIVLQREGGERNGGPSTSTAPTLELELAWEAGAVESYSKIAPPESVLRACGTTADAVGAGKVASTLASLM